MCTEHGNIKSEHAHLAACAHTVLLVQALQACDLVLRLKCRYCLMSKPDNSPILGAADSFDSVGAVNHPSANHCQPTCQSAGSIKSEYVSGMGRVMHSSSAEGCNSMFVLNIAKRNNVVGN